ncbi:MAG: glycosyltransferase [Steroidobacteraceae bacterium]|nr:glycosyltransferase [Deltaproteobacteria bacterium]
MMNSPTVDIIVPVWNSHFETRACLAAILEHSPEARLIIVDNGSSRETELMLEEFSESLGERGLFIKSERNIGLVPAINMGLARSDSDFAVIVRPQVLVHAGWLATLLSEAEAAEAGIVSPLFYGNNAPSLPGLAPGCTLMESCTVSFAVLLLRGEMRILAGTFDERLDGGEWCLKEYVRRVADKGYRTCITARVVVDCGAESQFGSTERRAEMENSSKKFYLDRWGDTRDYVVYFGKGAQAAQLSDTIDTILDAARRGHRFALLLHRRQYSDFRRLGWNGLHTAIKLHGLSMLLTQRDLQRTLALLQGGSPDLVSVWGEDGTAMPGGKTAISLGELLATISGS